MCVEVVAVRDLLLLIRDRTHKLERVSVEVVTALKDSRARVKECVEDVCLLAQQQPLRTPFSSCARVLISSTAFIVFFTCLKKAGKKTQWGAR